jgi:hypothetical protein
MRKSFNTLSALVVGLGREVLSGHFFLLLTGTAIRSQTVKSAIRG